MHRKGFPLVIALALAAAAPAEFGRAEEQAAASPPVVASPVSVPEGDGAPVVTDGIFSPGEWDDALRLEPAPGVSLYLKEYRGVVFVGVRGGATAKVGPSELSVAAPGGPITKLHVSSQLGEIALPATGEEPPFRFGLTDGWYANEFRRDVEKAQALRKEGKTPIEIIRASEYPSEGIEFAIRRSKVPGPRWLARFSISAFLEDKPSAIVFPPNAPERTTDRWLDLRFTSVFHEKLRNGDVAGLASALDKTPSLAKAPDAQGVPPLIWASFYGQKDVVELLLARGADPKASCLFGTALSAAVIRGKPEIIPILVRGGANPDDGGANFGPPLTLAARFGRLTVVEALLDAGASVASTDAIGDTALLIAASYGHEPVVRLLLSKRSDPNIANARGDRPLDAARRQGHAAVAACLEDSGAAAGTSSPALSGPYLGQTPPGKTPKLFAPSIVSTERRELNASFLPDGTAMIFARDSAVMMTAIEDGRWSPAAPAPFSRGGFNDVDAFVTPDGREIYFCSNRPRPDEPPAPPATTASPTAATSGSRTPPPPPPERANIWVVSRTGAGWSEPAWIGPLVSSRAADYYPTLTRDGTLYFSSNRPGGLGENDIYRARRVDGAWTAPENLGRGVSSEYREFDPLIAPDESCLIFASTRPGGLGQADLYISFRDAGGGWSEPRNMGPAVNSAMSDYTPMLSPDGKYLFFTSNREGQDDIFWVDAGVIDDLRPRPTVPAADAGGPSAPTASPAPPRPAGFDVFEFLESLDKPHGKGNWPGFDPAAWPIAVFDGTRTFLLRHPSPPPEFKPFPERPGVLVMPGRHPEVRGNSTRDIGGVRTATVVPRPDRPAEDAKLAVVEELFHVFWHRTHDGFRPNEMARYAYPVKDVRNLRGLMAEDEALARALEAGSAASAAGWTSAALRIRKDRQSRLTAQARDYETGMEMMEGTANAVARLAVGQGPRETAERLRRPRAAEEVRWRFYETGAAICLLLDRFRPGWKTAIDGDPAQTTVGLLEQAVSPLTGTISAFTGPQLIVFESRANAAIAELSARQDRLRSELQSRGGGRVVVEVADGREPMAVGRFDPVNLLVLDGGEVVHPNFIALTLPQGSIELTNPAFARGAFGGTVALTRGAGRHPLVDGIRALTIVGLGAAPKAEMNDGRLTIEAEGLRIALRDAVLTRDGETLRVAVPAKPPAAPPSLTSAATRG